MRESGISRGSRWAKARTGVWILILLLALLPVLPMAASAIEPDDDIPGVPLPASPVLGSLAPPTDGADFYSVDLVAGQKFTVTMTGPAAADYDLYLFKPGTQPLSNEDFLRETVVAWSEFDYASENIAYTATATGTYYLAVVAWDGSGSYTLTWSIGPGGGPLMPVYRFYNVKTGVHFYTANEAEKLNMYVNINLYNVYHYEGIGYQVNTANPDNSLPLYRFYNAKANVHFYTASETEKANVIAHLSAIYHYEGVAYKVSATPTNGTPVYRFYNFKKGVHFYTANEAEKASVIANLSGTYRYEGIGYYIGK